MECGGSSWPSRTCVVGVMPAVAHARQPPQTGLSLVHLVGQVARVGVPLPRLHVLPPAGLVLVVGVVLLVLHPEALGFLHERPLLVLREQAVRERERERERERG